MSITRLALVAALLTPLAVVPPEVAAQGENLAFAYRVEVHTGQERAFEAAMREHMAVRQEAGEPFEWQVYQSTFGDDAGSYFIRSPNHSWADMDTYGGMPEFQEAVGEHFDETMTPFIAESAAWVSMLDTAMSALPPNMEEMNVFMVTRVSVDSEGAMAMEEALQAFHETAAENDMYHMVVRTMVGGEGADLVMIFPSLDFAGLEEPSPSMDELMMQAHGEEGLRELYGKWMAGIEDTSTSLLVLRRDLSGTAGGT